MPTEKTVKLKKESKEKKPEKHEILSNYKIIKLSEVTEYIARNKSPSTKLEQAPILLDKTIDEEKQKITFNLKYTFLNYDKVEIEINCAIRNNATAKIFFYYLGEKFNAKLGLADNYLVNTSYLVALEIDVPIVSDLKYSMSYNKNDINSDLSHYYIQKTIYNKEEKRKELNVIFQLDKFEEKMLYLEQKSKDRIKELLSSDNMLDVEFVSMAHYFMPVEHERMKLNNECLLEELSKAYKEIELTQEYFAIDNFYRYYNDSNLSYDLRLSESNVYNLKSHKF